jgi:hypothetical protein
MSHTELTHGSPTGIKSVTLPANPNLREADVRESKKGMVRRPAKYAGRLTNFTEANFLHLQPI